jgi:hypothetical protein
MSSKIRKERVSAKIDECITELFGSEWRKKTGLRPSGVVDRFKEKFPETFKECGAEFAEGYIRDLASKRLRDGGAVLRAARARVLVLPGLDDSLLANLPPLITIPTSKGREEIHKPITHALMWEVRAYRKLLKEQIDNDLKRFEPVDFICQALKDQPDDIRMPEAWAAMMSETT